jgi:hypothetical protein
MKDEKRKAIVIWREAVEDVLFCVPRSISAAKCWRMPARDSGFQPAAN